MVKHDYYKLNKKWFIRNGYNHTQGLKNVNHKTIIVNFKLFQYLHQRKKKYSEVSIEKKEKN